MFFLPYFSYLNLQIKGLQIFFGSYLGAEEVIRFRLVREKKLELKNFFFKA